MTISFNCENARYSWNGKLVASIHRRDKFPNGGSARTIRRQLEGRGSMIQRTGGEALSKRQRALVSILIRKRGGHDFRSDRELHPLQVYGLC